MDHLIVALKPVIAARADWWDNSHDDWQERSLTRALPLAAMEYGVDAWQRSVLFLDAMRKRREPFVEHATEETLNVLDYDAKLVLPRGDCSKTNRRRGVREIELGPWSAAPQ